MTTEHDPEERIAELEDALEQARDIIDSVLGVDDDDADDEETENNEE